METVRILFAVSEIIANAVIIIILVKGRKKQ